MHPSRGSHSALARFGLASLLLAAAALAVAQSISEFAVPTAPPTDLYAMCVGPDGTIWFGSSKGRARSSARQ